MCCYCFITDYVSILSWPDVSAAHPENMPILSELCATLSRLAVRNEFCQDIVDLGGLKFMMTLLADSLDCQVRDWFVVEHLWYVFCCEPDPHQESHILIKF